MFNLKKKDIVSLSIVLTVIFLYIFYIQFVGYYTFTNYGKYTVGEVISYEPHKYGSRGGAIIYKYIVDEKKYEIEQGKNLFFIKSGDSGSKYVVLYNSEQPKQSILWVNYPCPDFALGDNLDSLVDKERVAISPWAIDLVVNKR